MSQADLAASAGKGTSAIGRWERGEVTPSLERLRDLVRAAGFEVTLGLAVADDHDVGLIRRCLSRTPAERLGDLVAAVDAVRSMSRAAHG